MPQASSAELNAVHGCTAGALHHGRFDQGQEFIEASDAIFPLASAGPISAPRMVPANPHEIAQCPQASSAIAAGDCSY